MCQVMCLVHECLYFLNYSALFYFNLFSIVCFLVLFYFVLFYFFDQWSSFDGRHTAYFDLSNAFNTLSHHLLRQFTTFEISSGYVRRFHTSPTNRQSPVSVSLTLPVS
jgi:hypothetical protein